MTEDVRAFIKLFQPELLPTGPSKPSPTELERIHLHAFGDHLLAGATTLKAHGSTATGLGARLMLEELGETLDAAARGDLVEFSDGLADLLYVVLWNAITHGVPIDAVCAEVHRANMAKAPICEKCGGSGRETLKLSPAASFFNGNDEEADVACDACAGKGRIILRDAAGKVTKPPGWTPPDVAGVLAASRVEWWALPATEKWRGAPDDWLEPLTRYLGYDPMEHDGCPQAGVMGQHHYPEGPLPPGTAQCIYCGHAQMGWTAGHTVNDAVDLLYPSGWIVRIRANESTIVQLVASAWEAAYACPGCGGSGIAPKGPASRAIGGGPDFDCGVCGGAGKLPRVPGDDPGCAFRVVGAAPGEHTYAEGSNVCVYCGWAHPCAEPPCAP